MGAYSFLSSSNSVSTKLATGRGLGNGWSNASAVFGGGSGTSVGNFGISFDTTNGAKLESLAPGVSWYPMVFSGNSFTFVSQGGGLTVNAASTFNGTIAAGNTTITGFANVSSTIRAGDNITINSSSPSLVFNSTTSGRTSTFGMTDAYNMFLNPPAGGILFIGATSHTANVSMANNYITAPVLQAYSERLTALGSVTGGIGLDLSVSNFFTLTATGNITFSYSNAPSGRVFAFTIVFVQDATGGRTITWPTGTKWPGGVVPPPTTTANAVDIWSVMTYDGGTTWISSLSVKNAS